MSYEEALDLFMEVKNCSLPWDDKHFEALELIEKLLKEKCGIKE